MHRSASAGHLGISKANSKKLHTKGSTFEFMHHVSHMQMALKGGYIVQGQAQQPGQLYVLHSSGS